jgi:D-glycero-alpha-D-manno-heptose-7-phosphate kinase
MIVSCGGAGGGFLLCPKPAQAKVRHGLCGLQSVDFRFDWEGARIAFTQ